MTSTPLDVMDYLAAASFYEASFDNTYKPETETLLKTTFRYHMIDHGHYVQENCSVVLKKAFDLIPVSDIVTFLLCS